MKPVRIVIALLVTLVLFYIARNTSRGRPETVIHEEQGFTFTMLTTPKALEFGQGTISVRIDGPIDPSMHVILRTGLTGKPDPSFIDPHQGLVHLVENADTAGLFQTHLAVRERGSKEYYFIQLRDARGNLVSSFAQADGYPFVMKSIGDVPIFVLVGHIALMFATVFCVTMAAIHAFDVIVKSGTVLPMTKWYLWAVIFSFLGCYPFGWGMNWFAFGTVWEGVPFGTDATDNKTQLLFVYLLFVLLASLGSLTNGKLGRDLYSGKALGWFGVVGFLMVWAIYLVPHSIQFTAAFTYAVCYSFIGLVLALYIAGRVKSRDNGQSPVLRSEAGRP